MMKLSAREEAPQTIVKTLFGTTFVSLLIFAVVISSGCVASERPTYTASEADRAQISGFENIRAHVDDPRPPASMHDPWRPVTSKDKAAMLAISGGGSGGRFRGWCIVCLE